MLTGTYDMTSGMDMEANLEEFALQSQWCTRGGKERFCLNVARFVKKYMEYYKTMFSRWLTLPSDRSCLLVGPRRSGKTTLLKQQFPDLEYRTLNDLDFLDWAEQDPKGTTCN
jgi:hypothetical protein